MRSIAHWERSTAEAAGYPVDNIRSGEIWVIKTLLATIAVLAVTGCSTDSTPAPPRSPIDLGFGCCLVFFDWDRSTLSQQALTSIEQAANLFKFKGNARVTVNGHTDRSGPETYNMALSLRRAAVVRDVLVRDGVPETAIVVVGKGETQPLVPTPDGVREPQNRRVEIVIH
jgi:OOP family OmpA-OmpF porin